MIQLNNVSKKYDGKLVFDQISCQLEHGILHIMGANGSGKTTLLNMMSGSLRPDQGQILYAGSNIYDKENYNIKKIIGYIPDNAPIYPFLSGKDFLKFICKVKNTKWPSDLIQVLNLERHLDTKFISMSYGTKKKFLFVSGIMSNPHYLILDEPMNGLDQHAISEMFRLLTEYLDCDKSICIIVTHDLSWIDKWREHYPYYPLTLQA
ncbi:MAG: ABC transporter ATP-binding protein [Tatlockia sp.]|nr:ABC transporter ATP-binding protein [Tatlockia sp.]